MHDPMKAALKKKKEGAFSITISVTPNGGLSAEQIEKTSDLAPDVKDKHDDMKQEGQEVMAGGNPNQDQEKLMNDMIEGSEEQPHTLGGKAKQLIKEKLAALKK